MKEKIEKFFTWLAAVAELLNDANVEVRIVIPEPFNEGGPFPNVPLAVISAEVLYLGYLARTPDSGVRPERRGRTLALYNMDCWPDPVKAAKTIWHGLSWFSQPESYFADKVN